MTTAHLIVFLFWLVVCFVSSGFLGYTTHRRKILKVIRKAIDKNQRILEARKTEIEKGEKIDYLTGIIEGRIAITGELLDNI